MAWRLVFPNRIAGKSAEKEGIGRGFFGTVEISRIWDGFFAKTPASLQFDVCGPSCGVIWPEKLLSPRGAPRAQIRRQWRSQPGLRKTPARDRPIRRLFRLFAGDLFQNHEISALAPVLRFSARKIGQKRGRNQQGGEIFCPGDSFFPIESRASPPKKKALAEPRVFCKGLFWRVFFSKRPLALPFGVCGPCCGAIWPQRLLSPPGARRAQIKYRGCFAPGGLFTKLRRTIGV